MFEEVALLHHFQKAGSNTGEKEYPHPHVEILRNAPPHEEGRSRHDKNSCHHKFLFSRIAVGKASESILEENKGSEHDGKYEPQLCPSEAQRKQVERYEDNRRCVKNVEHEVKHERVVDVFVSALPPTHERHERARHRKGASALLSGRHSNVGRARKPWKRDEHCGRDGDCRKKVHQIDGVGGKYPRKVRGEQPCGVGDGEIKAAYPPRPLIYRKLFQIDVKTVHDADAERVVNNKSEHRERRCPRAIKREQAPVAPHHEERGDALGSQRCNRPGHAVDEEKRRKRRRRVDDPDSPGAHQRNQERGAHVGRKRHIRGEEKSRDMYHVEGLAIPCGAHITLQ